MARNPESSSMVMAVDKALAILEWLSETDGSSQSVRTIAESTGIGKSTVHRLLETLATRGWVVQGEEGSYKLGTKSLHISAAVLRQLDILATIRPYAMRLRGEIAQTVFICVRDDDALLIVDIFESPSQLRFTRPIGSRSLLHGSAAGKALLSDLPLGELDEYLTHPLGKTTPKTITDPDELRHDLEFVRSRGYALSDEEGYIGIMSYGAAIYDYTGAAIASISVSGPRHEMIENQEEFIAALRRSTELASRQLGGSAKFDYAGYTPAV